MSPSRIDWTSDELILALDLYLRLGARIAETHPEVMRLSEILRALPQARTDGAANHRSASAVHLKLQNFLAIDPAYGRAAMGHGSKSDRQIWNEFAGRRKELAHFAAIIRASAGTRNSVSDDDEIDFPEGGVTYALHRRLERNRGAAKRAKAAQLRKHGRNFCQVCAFDFERAYGPRGRDWIEVHHDVPVSTLGPNARTKLADLKLVCANCHRMIHRLRPWLTVSELKKLTRS